MFHTFVSILEPRIHFFYPSLILHMQTKWTQWIPCGRLVKGLFLTLKRFLYSLLLLFIYIIFKNKYPTWKKKNIYINTTRGTEDKATEARCIYSHCFHLTGSRTDYKQNAVRDVGLIIGNTQFIHVISLSPFISYSQLKMGAERES